MILPSIRAAITAAGGTPTQVSIVGLLRELVTAFGGTPTQFTTIGLLREAVTAKGGTPTQFTAMGLLRELLTAGGATPPTTFYEEDFWAALASIVPPSSGPINYVTNGTFTGNDATGWNLSTVGTISGDKLLISNTSGLNKTITYTFPVAPSAGTVCTLSFDVSDFVANGGGAGQQFSLCVQSLSAPLITANGTYSVLITAGSGTGTLTMTVRNNMSLSIDNVSVVG